MVYNSHSGTSKESSYPSWFPNATQEYSFATTDHHQINCQAQKELIIEELYTEVRHLRHVIHALVTERDREPDMSQTLSGSLKSPSFEEMSSQFYDDNILDEALVSDETLKDGESDMTTPTESDTDLNYVVPLRRCGTPCSAPPRFCPVSATDRPCLIKRCSSFTSLEELGISRDYIQHSFSYDEEDTESFDGTQEDYIYFPRVNDVSVEHHNPWCIMPTSGPRPPRPKPRQRYEVKDYHLTFSSLWSSMQSPESDDAHEAISEQIYFVGNPTPSLGSEDTDLDSHTFIPIPYVDIETDDLDIQCPPRPNTPNNLMIQDCLNDSIYHKIDVPEEEKDIGMIPIAQPNFISPLPNSYYQTKILSQVLRTRDMRNRYPSRAFHPSLSLISEMDEILIPILESSLSESRSLAMPTSLRRSKQIVTDNIRRFVEFDLQSAKQNKKTWFDMAMEDEELEDAYSY